LAAILAAAVAGYSRLMGEDREETCDIYVEGLRKAGFRRSFGARVLRRFFHSPVCCSITEKGRANVDGGCGRASMNREDEAWP